MNKNLSAKALIKVVATFLISLIFLGGGAVNAQTTFKTRLAGAANWSSAATWIQARTGTVAFTNGSATVTGTGTSFTTELQVGDILMMDATPATVRGTVASIQSNTSLTLTSNATANVSTAAFGRQAVPGATDNVTIGNSAVSAITLSLNQNVTIGSLTFLAINQSNVLNHAGTNTLTVTNNVTLNQPTGSVIVAWNINAGTGNVGGSLNFPGTSTTTGRVCKTVVTTGTLNITGDLVYTPVAGATAVMAVVDLSGGAATMNIAGSILLNGGGTGTLTPGSSSTVIFNGTGAQSFTSASAIGYNNITINKTAGTATMASAITMAGNLLLSQGTLATANNDITIAGNWTNNGATFSPGSGTVTFNGTGAQQIAGSVASRTYNNITIAKTAGTLLSTTGGVTTITANNLTQTTGNFTAPATMNIDGSLLISAGTYTAGSNTNIGGNYTLNVLNGFVHSSGTVNFNGSSSQTIAGSQVTSFNNLTVTNTASSIAVSTNANVSGTLNLNGSATSITPAAAIVFNSAGGAGTVTGTGTIRVSRIAATADLVNQYKFSTYTFTNLTVDYNGAGAQAINNYTYNNLLVSGSGTKTASANLVVNGTLDIASGVTLDLSTFTLSGTLATLSGTGSLKTSNTSATPIPSGRSWTYGIEYSAAAGGQTIVAATYSNLTNSNTSNSNTVAANIVVNGALTMNTSSVLNMGSFTLTGSLTSITGSGTLRTQNTSSLPIPTGKSWSGTVEYFNAAGGQTIVAGTYTNLINSNTSNVNNAAASFTVSSTLTLNTGSTIDLGTNTLSGITTLAGTGNIMTQNSSASPLPSGKTWTGSVEYNNPSGGQTIVAGTYSNLILSNTSGVQTVAGTLSVSGTVNINTGATLDMGTNALNSATSISGAGTLRTQNISATPLPAAATWTVNVVYNSTAAQTVVHGNYINLDISGGNRTISALGTLNISGLFTPGTGVITVASSIIEFSGSNQTIPPMVYNLVTISGTKNFPAGSITISGLTISPTGVLNFSGGTVNINANSSINGTLNQTGGTLLSGNQITVAPVVYSISQPAPGIWPHLWAVTPVII